MFFMILQKPISRNNLVLSWWPKMLSASQIAVFFDHQYLWKESSDVLNFLHVDKYHRKVAYEATTFGWV